MTSAKSPSSKSPSSKFLSAFPITPCDAAGRVDAAALQRLLAPLLAAGVDSIGLLGSTGSYPYLTRGERRRALEIGVAAANGTVPILVGVGALRTDEAVALAQDARSIGAAAGLLAPVSYTSLTGPEVLTHYTSVARDGGLPLHIYDNPSTTHFAFTPELVGQLARVPGIVALKNPAPVPDAVAAHLGTLRDRVPDGFAIGYSGDWHAMEALVNGADGWYSVAAGLFPKCCVAMVRVAERDPTEARRLHAAMEPLWRLFRRFTGLRTVYAAADILGLCRSAPPRPILPLDAGAYGEIAATLRVLDLA